MMGSMVIEDAPPHTKAVASQQSPMSLKRTLSPKGIRSVVSPRSVYSKVFHHQPKPCMFLGRSKSARTLCCNNNKDLFHKTGPPLDDDDDDDDDDGEEYYEEEEEEDATVTMGSSSFLFKTITRDSLMLEQRKHSSMSYLNRRSGSSQFDNVLGQDDSISEYDNRSKQHQQEDASNLSFADAKRIWMREWLKSQQQRRSCEKDNNNEQQQHTYIESSFDYNDLERSLQEQQQQEQHESTTPRRIDFAGTVFGPSRLSSTRTSSTCTSNSSIISHPITEEEEEAEEEEEKHRIANKSVEQEDSAATATVLSAINDTTTTTTTSPPAAGSSSSRTVTFTTITIQEYPMIPGVSPGGTYGVPVTIDWIPYDPVTIDLQSYEKWRLPNRRNHQQEMQIPWFHREQILKRLGFNQRHIREASREAKIARKQRCKSNSITTFYLDDTMYRLELMIRTIRNLLTLGQKKRKEREYLAQCNNVSFCKVGDQV